MSRSPKYSVAQLGTKVRDQIRRDREERRRRRDTAEARIRDRVLAEGRAEVVERHRTLAAALATLGTESGTAAAASALVGAARHLRDADTFTELAAASAELDRVEQTVLRLRTERVRRVGTERIDALAAALREAGPAARYRSDPAGASDVDSRLERLRDADEPAAEEVDELDIRVRRHLDRVTAGRAEREEQRRKAAARIDQLAARLDDLRADARAGHVPLRDEERAAEALTLLRAQFAGGDFADVLRLGTLLERRIDDIESALDSVIDQLAERRTILTSLIRALPGVGFAVDPGSLTESADGAIGLRAVRPGGDSLAVVVEDEAGEGHRVLYDTDALRREERAGRGVTACRELLEVLDAVQESAGRDGVLLGQVTWEGNEGRPRPPSGATRRLSTPATEAGRSQENPSWRP